MKSKSRLKSLKYITLSLLGLVLTLNVLAQNARQITGTVTDSEGVPLPGLTIVIQGTTSGTVTGNDGKYELNRVSPEATLVFSFVGMTTQNMAVGEKAVIDVIMQADAIGLDEVVAIGYGTKKKSDLTGSVSSLDEDVFVAQPTTSLEQGIQGRLAGVQVIQSSGQPGAGMSIKVRGTSSFSGGTEPLYVIDGLPMVNFDVSNSNALSTINPNDIASIEILKDAAATAIYGSRAANGVILITTKSGESGAPQISYNMYVGVQTLRDKVDMMSGDEFEQYVKDYYNNPRSVYSPEEIAEMTNQLNQFGGANTDWHDEIYQPAIQQAHDLNVSGGTDKTKYFMSAGYLSQDGIAKNTDFERYSMRMNLNSKVSNRVDVTGRLNASRAIQNGFVSYDGTNSRIGGKNGVGSVLNAYPNVKPFNEDGSLADVAPFGFSGAEMENPYAFLEATDRNTTNRVLSGLDINMGSAEKLR